MPFIHHQNLRIGEYGAGERHQLFLPGRKPAAALSGWCLVACLELLDEFIRVRTTDEDDDKPDKKSDDKAAAEVDGLKKSLEERDEKITDMTHDIKHLRIRLIEPETIDFKPGQYIQLQAPAYGDNPEPVYRAYSMSSLPSETGAVDQPHPSRRLRWRAAPPDGARAPPSARSGA